ncbi:MAG: HAMP domain-containing histidine kinase [Nitrospinae bacterium]|nr:HAMP domain-containing histidine kinase [Nitrospinota bacterium]
MTSSVETGNLSANAGILPSRLRKTALLAIALFVFSNIPDYFLGPALFTKMLYVKLAGIAVFAGFFAAAREWRTYPYYIALTFAQVITASAVTGMNMYLSGGRQSTWALAPGIVILVTGLLMPLPAAVIAACSAICFGAYLIPAFALESAPVDIHITSAHIFYYAAFTGISGVSAFLQSGFLKSQGEKLERIRALSGELDKREIELENKNSDLVRQTERAMESSRLKSEFLANISHELRTPLTSIIGFSNLLSKGHGDSDEKTMLDKISENGARLLGVISDIIELSRIEAGMVEISSVPCSACAIIDGVVNSIRENARKKNIEISVECPASHPSVTMDQMMVGLAATKLLENAIKFSPEGGNVTIGCQVNGQFVEIYVSDSGTGLSGPERDVIFESFRQADGSSSRKHGGLGIGLTLARRIAILHGGRISVDSKPGEGSRFTICIPMAAQPSAGMDSG